MDIKNKRITRNPTQKQTKILDCLYENMLQMPYSSIRISDICRQVGISRRGYYLYFGDKDACLDALIDRYIQKILILCSNVLPENPTPLQTHTALLTAFMEDHDFLDALIRNDLLYAMMNRGTYFAMTEDRIYSPLTATPNECVDSDVLACHVNCMLTLILRWQRRGFDLSPEDMARKCLEVFNVFGS